MGGTARKITRGVKKAAKGIAGGFLTGGIMGGSTTAALGLGGRLLSGAMPKPPEAPDVKVIQKEIGPEPTIDREGEFAREAEIRRQRKARGRASTQLTGAQGVTTPANVGTAKLLG